MHEAIENYLSGLENRLKRKMSAQTATEHVREIRDHLQESFLSHQGAGKDDREAAIMALRGIGCDLLLAENLVRAHKGLPDRSAWQFLFTPLVILAFGVLTTMVTFNMHPTPAPSFSMFVAQWFPWAFFAALVVSTVRARKLLVVPLLTSFVALLLVVCTWGFIWGEAGISGSSQEKRARIFAEFDAKIKEKGQEAIAARQIMEGSAFPQSMRMGTKYLAPEPLAGVHITSEGQHVRQSLVKLASFPDSNSARWIWKLYGDDFLQVNQTQLAELTRGRHDWTMLGPNWGTAVLIMRNITLSALPFILMTMALHLGIALLLRIRDAAIGRLWHPDRWVS